MRLKSLEVSALVTLAVLIVAPVEAQDPAGALVGAWVVESVEGGGWQSDPDQPGLLIFTEGGHYSTVFSIGERAAAASSFAPTDQEKVAQHESIIVNTGTYEVSGDTITSRPMIAKSPAFVGGQEVSRFEIDGDRLTLTGRGIRSADGVELPGGSVLTLRRLE